MPNAIANLSVGTTPQFVYKNPRFDVDSTDSRYASAFALHNDTDSAEALLVQWDEVQGDDWLPVQPGQSVTLMAEAPAPIMFVRVKSAAGTITVHGGVVGKRTAQDV
jgi:hypothetical protein